jgi:hypothetical protein
MKEDAICGHAACLGEIRNAYRKLVEELVGIRQLRICRCIWKDNITMDLVA